MTFATSLDFSAFYNEEKDTFSKTTSLSADEIIEYEELLGKTGTSGSDISDGNNSSDKVLYLALGGTLFVLLGAVLLLQMKIIKSRKNVMIFSL